MTMNRRTWIAAFTASVAGVASLFGAKLPKKPKPQESKVSSASYLAAGWIVQPTWRAVVHIEKEGQASSVSGHIYSIKLVYKSRDQSSSMEQNGQTAFLRHSDFMPSMLRSDLKSVGLGLIASKIQDLMLRVNRLESKRLGLTQTIELSNGVELKGCDRVDEIVFRTSCRRDHSMPILVRQLGSQIESLAFGEINGPLKLSIM